MGVGQRTKRKKTFSPEMEKYRELQKKVNILLYAAVLMHTFGSAFSLYWLDFLSGVPMLAFFLVEIFLLPPLGMLGLVILASLMTFLLYYIITTIAALVLVSVIMMVLSYAVCALGSGIIVTVSGGFILSIETVLLTPSLFLAGGSTAAVGGLAVAAEKGIDGLVTGVGDSAVQKNKRRSKLTVIGSLLVFVVIGWPMLSYAQGFSGVLACKPAVALSQAHLVYVNMNCEEKYKAFFTTERNNARFESGFYDKYINTGRGDLTQGGTALSYGNSMYMAYVADGVLTAENSDGQTILYTLGYQPKSTDALIIRRGACYIFGYNRVLIVSGGELKTKFYTWKKTKWTSEFEALTPQEQFEKVYDVLERQNTTDDVSFSFEDVAIVAYAQRNGLLINYDNEKHSAWFAHTDDSGKVTVYLQTSPGQREEQVTFEPDMKGDGVPYLMTGTGGIMYIKGNQVKYLNPQNNWAENNRMTLSDYYGEAASFTSLRYMDLADDGAFIIYRDDKDRLYIDPAPIGGSTIEEVELKRDVTTKAFVTAGNYVYAMQYKDNLLTKLTFITDFRSWEGKGTDVNTVWHNNYTYQRIELSKSLFGL